MARLGASGPLDAIRRRRAADPAGFRVDCVLGVLLLGLGVFLIDADPPWSGGVAERLAEGKRPRPQDWGATWGWWAAAANAALTAGLLLTRRHWLASPALANPRLAPPPRPTGAAWLAAAVVAAMLAGAALAWPRLGQSLWDDESMALKMAVLGSWERTADGGVVVDELEWRDTLWNYVRPTNHVAYSVAARLSIGAGSLLTARPPRPLDERWYRLPAWLAGVAGIGVTGLLVWRLGHPAGAPVAAWWLALHPWYLRYASEARGYAFVLLGLPLLLLLLVRALERGTWGRWLAYGGVQFVLLWSFPGLLPTLAIVNVVALGAQVLAGTPRAWTGLLRWGVACVASGMLYLQVMLPNLAQFSQMADRRFGVGLRADFTERVLAHLVAGAPWRIFGAEAAHPQLAEVAASAPLPFWLWVATALALVLAGALRLARRDAARALLACALLLPPIAVVAGARVRDVSLYVYYLVFALPLVAALLGVGFAGLWARLRGRAVALGTAAAIAWLGLYAWLGEVPRARLRAGSLQPFRESVLLTRPSLDAAAPAQAAILTASIYAAPKHYDPRALEVDDVAGLESMMDEADRHGRELFVNFGRLHLVRRKRPELLALVQDAERFEPVAVLRGFEPKHDRWVFRYRGTERARPGGDAPEPVPSPPTSGHPIQ